MMMMMMMMVILVEVGKYNTILFLNFTYCARAGARAHVSLRGGARDVRVVHATLVVVHVPDTHDAHVAVRVAVAHERGRGEGDVLGEAGAARRVVHQHAWAEGVDRTAGQLEFAAPGLVDLAMGAHLAFVRLAHYVSVGLDVPALLAVEVGVGGRWWVAVGIRSGGGGGGGGGGGDATLERWV